MSAKESKSGKYELVAPDGGWGYVIGLGVIVNVATLCVFMSCFGVMYKDMFIEINMDSTGVTLLSGVTALCVAISGFMAGPLQKCLSIRQLGLLAAFVYNLGGLCTVFVKSKLQLFIAQGLQGVGNGMMYNLSCTVLNNYFVKKRLLAFSLTQIVTAISCLFSPYFVKWSIENYGSQGTLLLVSAIYMHNFFGMSLMQPVEWHMKKVQVLEVEEKEIKLLLTEDKKIESNKNDLTSSLDSDNTELMKNHDSRIKFLFSQLIDYSLFKPFVLSNACVGIAFACFLDFSFTMLLPLALYNMGWNQSEVAKALTLCALADLVTRIVIMFMSGIFTKIGSHETFIGGLVIAFVSRIGMLWSNNNTIILAFITMNGTARCIITLFTPVVIVDAVGQENFTSAMGISQMLYGICNITVGPIIGVIRDLTGSYSIAFYVSTACFGAIIISWSTELVYKRTIRRKFSKTDICFKS